MSTDAAPAPVFKKKARPGAKLVRKRSASPSAPAESPAVATATPAASSSRLSWGSRGGGDVLDDEASGGSSVVFKARRVEHNPLRQGTISARSKRARAGGEGKDGEASDDADADATSSRADRFGESSIGTFARATGVAKANANSARDDATRESDWQLQDEDARLGRATKRSGVGDVGGAAVTNDDGLYRGAGAYSKFTEGGATVATSAAAKQKKGPTRVGSNVRTTSVVDYQPDVCKDYKETGYCGFGDTCKFLHDRSDYLAGWQLDSLMPNSSARRDQLGGGDDGDESDEDEEIPFACLLCRRPFEEPVVTRCGHYFCSSCAIRRFSRTSKCFACGAQTAGIFNSATKVLERMARRREQKADERRERRKRREWGDDDEDGEGHGERGEELIEGVEVGEEAEVGEDAE